MRLVVIGCGGMGSYHIKKFTSLGAKVVGAVDLNLVKLKKIQEKYNLNFIASTVDGLEPYRGKFDAVSIAVVDSLHISVLNRVLKYDVPIFMEKPLAYDYKQIRNININNNYKFMINYSKHNFKGILALKKYIDNPIDLGTLESVKISYLQNWTITKCWGDYITDTRWNWRLNPDISCLGCLGDLGSHCVDILLYLFPNIKYDSLNYFKLFDGKLFESKDTNPIFSTCDASFKSENVNIEMLVSNESDKEDDLIIELKYKKGKIEFNNKYNRNIININIGKELKDFEIDESFSTYKSFIDLVDYDIDNFLNLNFAIKVQELLDEVAKDVSTRNGSILK